MIKKLKPMNDDELIEEIRVLCIKHNVVNIEEIIDKCKESKFTCVNLISKLMKLENKS